MFKSGACQIRLTSITTAVPDIMAAPNPSTNLKIRRNVELLAKRTENAVNKKRVTPKTNTLSFPS